MVYYCFLFFSVILFMSSFHLEDYASLSFPETVTLNSKGTVNIWIQPLIFCYYCLINGCICSSALNPPCLISPNHSHLQWFVFCSPHSIAGAAIITVLLNEVFNMLTDLVISQRGEKLYPIYLSSVLRGLVSSCCILHLLSGLGYPVLHSFSPFHKFLLSPLPPPPLYFSLFPFPQQSLQVWFQPTLFSAYSLE